MDLSFSAHPSNATTSLQDANGGALILPCIHNDTKGVRIFKLNEMHELCMGGDYIAAHQGPRACGATLCFQDNHGTPHFYVTDLTKFASAYQRALKNNLVSCLSFTTVAEPAKSPSITTQRSEEEEQKLGQLIEGKGVYVGSWFPQPRDGMRNTLSARAKFNIYAAPTDILDLAGDPIYLTVQKSLRELHDHEPILGHPISKKFNEDAILKAAQREDYDTLGQWFVPPVRFLFQEQGQKDRDVSTTLFDVKQRGHFVNRPLSTDNAYISCTPARQYDRRVRVCRLDNGTSWDTAVHLLPYHTRLMRLEPAKP